MERLIQKAIDVCSVMSMLCGVWVAASYLDMVTGWDKLPFNAIKLWLEWAV